jgi:Family of unknown function (DUF6188)
MLELRNDAEGSEVILVDAMVSHVTLGTLIDIVVAAQGDSRLEYLETRIACPMRVRRGSGEWETIDLDNADRRLGDLMFDLRFRPVESVKITREDVLHVELGGDMIVEVPPDSDYIAWELKNNRKSIAEATYC